MPDDPAKDDDNDLFRREMGNITPLKSDNRVRHKVKRKPPLIKSESTHSPLSSATGNLFSTEAVVDECPAQLSFARSGLQHSVLKKLRQGKIPIEHSLDLHGSTVEEARLALMEFLDECTSASLHCVIVVHGKGFRSPEHKPVIKPMVNRWLREAPSVLAFVSAMPAHGGNGAVYVLLKKESRL